MRWIGLHIAVAVVLGAASPASAETFTVTGFGDSTGSPPCAGGTSCPSIREALAAAEANGGGADTIVIPPGDTQLIGGHLQVDSPVTIVGAGARATHVLASTQIPSRVFNVVGVTASISSLTMSGGSEIGLNELGGNVFNSGGNLLLDHVRVTDGTATSGGGVANSAGTLTIQYSLIDDNRIDGTGGADGGGILNSGSASPGILTVRDSTITGNSAAAGGGIFAGGSTVTTLQRVTIAHNGVGSDGSGGGVSVTPSQPFTIQGSILALNTGDGPSPANCSTALPTSLGANVVAADDCNFTAAGDAQNIDPQLSPMLVDAGGQTNVFTIPATSPAFDHVPGCAGADQRDFGRPQGPACDSGAYEIDQVPETVLSGTPPTFTFSSPEPGVAFQCRLDAAAFAPCTSPQTYSGLAPGAYTFSVRAVDGAGNVDPTPASQAFTVQEPTPEFHKTVVVKKLSGRVRVRLKGSRRFVTLNAATGIPLGSTVDVKRGVVELTSMPGRNAKAEKAKFYAGIFTVTQPGKITQLRLSEALAKCKSGGASAAAKKAKKRKLWGDGKGKFRTKGSYSSATVRGTKWLVSDSCAGTLTRVVRGVVTVRDRVKRKTIRVRAGERYLARP